MNEHKRVKMGMMPGEYGKCTKIAMMESTAAVEFYGPYAVYLDAKVCKAFKKIIRSKERARLKERFKDLEVNSLS